MAEIETELRELGVEVESAGISSDEEGDPGRDKSVLELESLREELHETRAKLSESERLLASSREAVDALERRREIDAALVDAEVRDLEVARLLTESAIAGMEDADISSAVEEIRASRPGLFAAQQRGGTASGIMAGFMDGGSGVEGAAHEARASGDRAALLRYLRARRGVR